MSLSAGTRLGPYEILAPLGAGGMGEVYRARNGRLEREVAVKVLPAAVSSDADRREVYLRPVEASGERLRVSSGGGTMPRWRRDGKELYYLAPDDQVMGVALSTGARSQPGVAAALFRVEGVVRDYDVAADGQRFLVDVAEPDSAPISVLANWPALLPKENVR